MFQKAVRSLHVMVGCLAVIAMTPAHGGVPKTEMSDLDLFKGIVWGRFAASDHYQCLGYSREQAEIRVKEELGQRFRSRLQRVSKKLVDRYGDDEVMKQTEIILIGYKLTRERCRKLQDIMHRIRSQLSELEKRLDEH